MYVCTPSSLTTPPPLPLLFKPPTPPSPRLFSSSKSFAENFWFISDKIVNRHRIKKKKKKNVNWNKLSPLLRTKSCETVNINQFSFNVFRHWFIMIHAFELLRYFIFSPIKHHVCNNEHFEYSNIFDKSPSIAKKIYIHVLNYPGCLLGGRTLTCCGCGKAWLAVNSGLPTRPAALSTKTLYR